MTNVKLKFKFLLGWCRCFPCVHFLLRPFLAGFPDLRECWDPELLSGPVDIAGTFEAQHLQTVTGLCEENNERETKLPEQQIEIVRAEPGPSKALPGKVIPREGIVW